jgi:integrase
MSTLKPTKTKASSESNANRSEHQETGIDSKSGWKVAGRSIGKSDARYWQQPKKLDVDPRGNGALFCRIQVNGRREPFPLRTHNRSTAAAKAAKIYLDVVALGWDAAISKYKPDATKPRGSTVGELIAAVSELANVRPTTLRGYAANFRRIAADVMGIEAKASRFARCGGGREAWLAAVDAVPLAKLTPDRIEAWKLRYVSARSAGDESKARSARNSANSLIRMSKGLFAKRLLKLAANRISLPSPLPFDSVELFKRQSMRYVSTMNLESVLVAARDDLANNDPEGFKAFVLCLFAGLRRNEADKLRWNSIDFEAGAIRIEAQSDFAPKAETSLGDIPIDPELCAILRGLRAKEPKAEYVLAADEAKRTFTTKRPAQTAPLNLRWSRYRAADSFKRLADWLRTHGVNSRTPLHTLRKEAGSLICQQHGLFAASRFLRHADVAITAQHYAAQKERVTVGLGAMLAREPANIVEADFKPAEKPIKSKRRA